MEVTPRLIPTLCSQRIASIACGWGQGAAVTEEGQLWVWGMGSEPRSGAGALGVGHTSNLGSPHPVTMLPAGVKIVKVVIGYDHMLALSGDGEIYSWGNNNTIYASSRISGRLGYGDVLCQRTPRKIPDFPPEGLRVVEISCGRYHSAAITDDGQLWMWGCNRYGVLGLGDKENRKSPTPVMALQGKRVAGVSCNGEVHTVAVTDRGRVYIWYGISFFFLALAFVYFICLVSCRVMFFFFLLYYMYVDVAIGATMRTESWEITTSLDASRRAQRGFTRSSANASSGSSPAATRSALSAFAYKVRGLLHC